MSMTQENAADAAADEKAYFLIIRHIRMLVQEGEIAFGGKLPSERQLMSDFGLSRNSVREALRTLENMGIIESRQGQGNFFVNHVDKSLKSIFSLLLSIHECSYLEIGQLRRSIEIGAYLLAVRQAREEDVRLVADAFHELEESDTKERVRLDKKFHDTLIEISGNRLLKLLNETLSQLFEDMIREVLFHVSAQEWEKIMTYHGQMYGGLLERDKVAGIAAIMEHYDFTDDCCMRYSLPDYFWKG